MIVIIGLRPSDPLPARIGIDASDALKPRWRWALNRSIRLRIRLEIRLESRLSQG